MTVAYVSRRCEDCDSFVRTAAGRLRLVYVEDAAEIPWYIESVPTVVVESRGEDGALAYDLYAGDDAFALIEPKRPAPVAPVMAPRGPMGAHGPMGQMGPMGAMGQMAPRSPPRSPPRGPSARGDDGALFECIDAEDGMACGAFEALVPLGTEDDRRRTESTMAEWERAVAEERAHSQKKEASQLDRDFEKLKKERGN